MPSWNFTTKNDRWKQ